MKLNAIRLFHWSVEELRSIGQPKKEMCVLTCWKVVSFPIVEDNTVKQTLKLIHQQYDGFLVLRPYGWKRNQIDVLTLYELVSVLNFKLGTTLKKINLISSFNPCPGGFKTSRDIKILRHLRANSWSGVAWNRGWASLDSSSLHFPGKVRSQDGRQGTYYYLGSCL